VRRAAVAGLIRGQKNATASELLRCARVLWAMPEREYQYVAVDLLARHADKLSIAHLPDLFALVQKKSWWDTVDALAGVIGRVMKTACDCDPAAQCAMDEALAAKNLWVRRVAIIHQLGWRKKTDAQRLFAYAVTCAHEKDFFIRKAIGWSLRDYARHAPGEVRAFLKTNRTRLSPLTMREAGKHVL
jgi:3-methyladenine DNA glycosylase AlkD